MLKYNTGTNNFITELVSALQCACTGCVLQVTKNEWDSLCFLVHVAKISSKRSWKSLQPHQQTGNTCVTISSSSSVYIIDAETVSRAPLLLLLLPLFNLGVLSSMLSKQNVFSGVSSLANSPVSYYRVLTSSLRD